MPRGSAWAARHDRAFASVEDPQQRRLAEWTYQDKQARRRAEFGARITAITAQVASEVAAAVALEVSAAVAEALQAARAGHHEYLDLAPTTTSTPTPPVADDLAVVPDASMMVSAQQQKQEDAASPQAIDNTVTSILAAWTPTTCSTQSPSRAVTVSVSAPAAVSTLPEVTVGVVTEYCCFDLEPATLAPTSALDILGACSPGINLFALPASSGVSAVVHTTCSMRCPSCIASEESVLTSSAAPPSFTTAGSVAPEPAAPEFIPMSLRWLFPILNLENWTPTRCSTKACTLVQLEEVMNLTIASVGLPVQHSVGLLHDCGKSSGESIWASDCGSTFGSTEIFMVATQVMLYYNGASDSFYGSDYYTCRAALLVQTSVLYHSGLVERKIIKLLAIKPSEGGIIFQPPLCAVITLHKNEQITWILVSLSCDFLSCSSMIARQFCRAMAVSVLKLGIFVPLLSYLATPIYVLASKYTDFGGSEHVRAKWGLRSWKKAMPIIHQMMLTRYNPFPAGNYFEMGLLHNILLQDWPLIPSSIGYIIGCGFNLLQWKIAWLLDLESSVVSSGDSGNNSFVLTFAHTSHAWVKESHHGSPIDCPAVYKNTSQFPFPVKTYGFHMIDSDQDYYYYTCPILDNTYLQIMGDCSAIEMELYILKSSCS